ncbi:MAG TPA: response regulator transcription factor [Gaiellaceae bacterium]|nr:response regulator transcription factor [Gaiellaceae bacterium]
MKVFILDRHSIYRCGLAASLRALDDMDAVDESASAEEAWSNPALPEADVVVVDPDFEGGHEFIRNVRQRTDAHVVVCSATRAEEAVLGAVQSGAVGFLCKDTLDADTLAAGVRATATGSGVVPPELLGTLLRNVSRVSSEVLEPRGLSLSWLTAREKQVLRLVANGHPTREVARQLCYSERTIKNVMHDVVTKMNARSRSQAVAEAVRAGLI